MSDGLIHLRQITFHPTPNPGHPPDGEGKYWAPPPSRGRFRRGLGLCDGVELIRPEENIISWRPLQNCLNGHCEEHSDAAIPYIISKE